MSFAELLLIAVGLSMDAFAVAVTSGATLRRGRVRWAVRMGVWFGGFQALMPVLGWLAGWRLRDYIRDIDHWIAFGLLLFIGGKMIWESRQLEREREEGEPCQQLGEGTVSILMLSIATSIDALAVGLVFSFQNVEIPFPAMVIGAVTFTLTMAGVYVGVRIGHVFEKRIGILGGLILIGIGTKILIEHLRGG